VKKIKVERKKETNKQTNRKEIGNVFCLVTTYGAYGALISDFLFVS
jgi:hypothetical protein